MSHKKKILILIEWFAPGYKAGGPIRSCVNMTLALKDIYEVYVLTTDTDHGETAPYPDIPSNTWTNIFHPQVQVYYAKKETLTRQQINREIHTVQPDFIYLNTLFSFYFVLYPLWLKHTRKIKGKIILCPRGTLYESALTVKRYKKQPFIYLSKSLGLFKHILFHATNSREEEAIRHYFPGSKVKIAGNLPSQVQLPLEHCSKNSGTLKCIFIARIVPIKNLLFLLKVLERVKAAVELSVVGPAEDKNYWRACRLQVKRLPPNIQVRFLGPKRPELLSDIVRQHHLFILPTAGENFGHAIFEALLAGRPVLISDQTPWLSLEIYKAGWDLPLTAPGAFAAVIEAAASWNQEQFDIYALEAWTYAKKTLNTQPFNQQYLNLFS